MTPIEVYPIGSQVSFGGASALVTGIQLRGPRTNRILYELVWWSNGCRNCQWVESIEIDPPGKNVVPIGFVNQGK